MLAQTTQCFVRCDILLLQCPLHSSVTHFAGLVDRVGLHDGVIHTASTAHMTASTQILPSTRIACHSSELLPRDATSMGAHVEMIASNLAVSSALDLGHSISLTFDSDVLSPAVRDTELVFSVLADALGLGSSVAQHRCQTGLFDDLVALGTVASCRR